MDLLEEGLKRYLAVCLGPRLAVTLTDNRRCMFTFRRRPDGAGELRLARYFALADPQTLDELADYLSGRVRRLPSAVRRFAESQPASPDRAKASKRNARPKGSHFDLTRIVRRIETDYFAGLPAATITWGRKGNGGRRRARRRTIQLGSYSPEGDLITIHPVLDAPFVPTAYVEMVVYHELLHKRQAEAARPGARPRLVHDKAFRADERRFAGWEEAMAWEKENLPRLLDERTAAVR
jgi:hypothetical protein